MELNQINDSSADESDIKANEEQAKFNEGGDIEKATELAVDRTKIRKLLAKLQRFRTDTILRSLLAIAFTLIIAGWLYSVLEILKNNEPKKYNLSDNVLIVLLTTSTINIIGMMLIILKNLFPAKKNKINEKSKSEPAE